MDGRTDGTDFWYEILFGTKIRAGTDFRYGTAIHAMSHQIEAKTIIDLPTLVNS